MILIRGIKGESYARRIEKGIVDCRDILSALLQPPMTGYEFSDYYEKNFAKALLYFGYDSSTNLHNSEFLHSLLIDYYIPHIYVTYFHILNKRSLEWLDKNFEEDYKFIAINVKLDRITKTAIGNEYFGAKMEYVNSIHDLQQDGFHNFQAACMCSIENLFSNKKDMKIPLQIYNTVAFPLLCREQDDKFTDIENEFRILAYDCPRIKDGRMSQSSRKATLTGKSGAEYYGILMAGEDTFFESNIRVFNNLQKSLKQILVEEQGMVTVDSQFKAINISDISDEYYYIGNKEQCKEFIKKMLMSKMKDIYVDRTVRKKYDRREIPNAVFVSGSQKVEY